MTDMSLTPERLAAMQAAFERVLDAVASEREALLRAIADEDLDLAERVRRLVAAHERAGLQGPIVAAAALRTGADHRIGTRVGVYEIVREIGAGGMGTVYEARRVDGEYRTRVAVKLLRQHADGEALRRRFADERQILASLHHPHIATLLDGGVTRDGQPYFVMEYLEGEPITRWCDARRLPVRARLELVEQVCAAVHHAHQSLVVHRDLKPGNVLVTADGVVKLLDFGIAKLLPADEADATITQVGSRPYTPDYASPEQLLGQPMGVRSDVYSLGVVLHELLTGARPFELTGKSAVEAARIVSDVTPARPSTQVRASHAPAMGERSPERARAAIAGDLDAIVLRALAKEPARRYGSAEELAADLRRHREGRAVVARPDGFGYRLGKLVRRHRVATAAIVLATVSLAGGVAATTAKAREALRERERATEVKDFLTTMLGAADPAAFGKDVQVRTVLDSAVGRVEALRGRPDLEADVREVIGGTYLALGEFALADSQYTRALDARRRFAPRGDRLTAVSYTLMSSVYEAEGRYEAADSMLRRSIVLFDRFGYSDAQSHADHLDLRGRILTRLGRIREAEPLLARALTIELGIVPVNDSSRSVAYANLGLVRSELGNNASAESLMVQALGAARRAFGDEHPLVAAVMSPLATVQERLGAFERADSTYRAVLAMREKLLGREHPEYAWTMFNYADFLLARGRNAEAADWARRVLALRGRSFDDGHPAIGTAMAILGRALDRQDSIAAGGKWIREALALRKRSLPTGHFLVASSESILGEHLVRERRFPEAERLLLASEQALVTSRGEAANIVADARNRIVMLYDAWGKPEQAAGWRAKLAR